MNKKTLICDIDDVLWDLIGPWCQMYNCNHLDINNIISPNLFKEWDISNILGELIANKMFEILNREHFWDYLVALQDRDLIKQTYDKLILLDDKYNLYIATATDYTKKHKLELFNNVYDCIDKDRIILIKDKWLLDCDIIIDDNPNTLEKFKNKGVRCVKINKPWNKDFNCENYNHFIDAAAKLLSEV